MNRPVHQTSASSNDFLSELLIGMSDGLIVPFALTVGLSQVMDSSTTVATVGVVAVSAGAVAMGIGGYLTGKSEMDVYNPRLSHHASSEITGSPLKEKEEVESFLANIGLSEELQIKAADDLLKEKKEWAQLLIKSETEDLHDVRLASKTGLNIGLAYALAGFIPVSPYFFMEPAAEALKISVLFTLACLTLLGYLKSRVTGIPLITSILRTTLTGSLAAMGAFVVARIFAQ